MKLRCAAKGSTVIGLETPDKNEKPQQQMKNKVLMSP